MIAYYPLSFTAEIEEGFVSTIVIENQSVFSKFVNDIYNQIEGYDGDVVLSDNSKIIELRKKAELVTQFVPFEVNKKDLLTKIYADLKLKAVNEVNYQKTQELIGGIYNFLYEISEEMDNIVTMNLPDDISGLLKIFDLRIADDDMSLSEKIMEYMTAVNRYKGEKVFFFVNLRSYLTDNQTRELFENIVLEKMNAYFIENKEYTRLGNEKVVIVDQDMCVI